MAGITGATSTPAGTPASLSCWITRKRAWGDAVRGSKVRLMSFVSDVTLTMTDTSLSLARSVSKSRSRMINALLVTMVTGCLQRVSTVRISRVICRRFSSG